MEPVVIVHAHARDVDLISQASAAAATMYAAMLRRSTQDPRIVAPLPSSSYRAGPVTLLVSRDRRRQPRIPSTANESPPAQDDVAGM